MTTSSPRRLSELSLWFVLLLAYGAIDLVLPVALRWAREPGWEAQGLAIEMCCLMASYGAIVGQWSVLAVWSALRPTRRLVTVAFCWAVASALFSLYLRAMAHFQAASVQHPSIWFVPLALLSMQAPFARCGMILGLRLSRAEVASNERLRFTIRDLLAVTATVAVILAVNRTTASPSTGGGLGGGGGFANPSMNFDAAQGLRLDFQLGQMAACTAFALIGIGVVWPVFYALFAIPRKAISGLILLATLLCATAVVSATSWIFRPGLSFAEFAWNIASPVLASWKQPNGGQTFAQLFIAVAGLVGGWAAAAIPGFLAFRLTGYQLISARPASTQATQRLSPSGA